MTETKIELSRVALGSLERARARTHFAPIQNNVCIKSASCSHRDRTPSELVLKSVHTHEAHFSLAGSNNVACNILYTAEWLTCGRMAETNTPRAHAVSCAVFTSYVCVLYVFYNQSHGAVIHLALIWMIEKSVAREIDGWIYARAALQVMQMHSFHSHCSLL